MIKYEEQVPLHHLVTVIEGRIAEGWRPIGLTVFDKMYTVIFATDETWDSSEKLDYLCQEKFKLEKMIRLIEKPWEKDEK